MRYPDDHKAETHKRIVRAAARLFRERGYDGVGVDAIMSEAGLTAGGFYAHFRSKEALFDEAIAEALGRGGALTTAKAHSESGSADGLTPLRLLVNSYLSRQHRDMVADGCPLPSLTPDVARSSEHTRAEYEQQVQRYLAQIAALLPGGSSAADDRSLAVLVQCVGGLMLARAVNDEDFSNRILKTCRKAAMMIGEQDL